MPKSRQEKEEILKRLDEDLRQRAVVLVDYQGLTVKEITELRDGLYNDGYKMLVTKNTILGRAIKNAGYEISDEALDLPLAIIVADDEVAVSKLVEKFAKTHDKITVIGGWIDGKFVDTDHIVKLSKLPGREELLAKLVGSINSPISGMVNVLAGNIRGLVNVIKNYQAIKP